jgi:(1->4)-alpha-D-glucan 1-alpha-D-glucosylmutase
VPRLVLGLAARGGWGDTTVELPPGRWRDLLGGTEVEGPTVALADLLAPMPVALLVAEPLWEEAR